MTTADLLRAEGEARGRAEGEARGRTEGRAEGRAAALLELLDIKFDQVPADIKQKVRTATTSQLEIWTRRILTTATLDEIFA